MQEHPTFDIEATDFALSSEGIHLLRSKFNYETIPYDKVSKATLTKGSEIKNVLLAFIVGFVLISFAILQSIHVLKLFQDPAVHRIYIQSIVLPVLPALIGAYLIYGSLKRRLVLIVRKDSARYKFRLKGIDKDSDSLIGYLREKLSGRFSYSSDYV